jgi:hypothetical protein
MRVTLRGWTELLETFVIEVIREERRDKRAAIARLVLYLLSKFYLVGAKLRRWLQRRSGRLR